MCFLLLFWDVFNITDAFTAVYRKFLGAPAILYVL